MRKPFSSLTLIFIFLALVQVTSAQQKWDLRRCVEYAVTNNISVKQADVQARIAELTFKQSKAGRWPSLSFSNSEGFQFGRSIDPATNLFTNQQIGFTQFQMGSNVSLFNWFSRKYAIEANELESKASTANIDKLKNDISLNVAAAYLQALLARERVRIVQVQVGTTAEQLKNTRKLVDAGTLPELNAAELEAQLATDSSSLIDAVTNYEAAILQMKLQMNMDPAAPFELDTPPVEQIPVEPFSDLMPDFVYGLAIKNQPQQKVNQLRMQSLQKFVKSAKAQMYPTLSAFAQITSSYSSALKNLPHGSNIPVIVPIGFTGTGTASNPNVFDQVMIPSGYQKATFLRQLDYQFRQNVGLSVSIPIFNGLQAKTNYERSKLNLHNQELAIDRDNFQLKQDIYSAYNNALAAHQRFVASQKTVKTAEYSYQLAKKRYEAGLLRSIDLITNQNNLYRARIQMVLNQFDYVFRMKVLEFYKGQGLKL